MQIIIYSTPTCGNCSMIKQFLKMKGIAFNEIDVSKNKEALREITEKNCNLSLPVIKINGKIIIGNTITNLILALKNVDKEYTDLV